MAWYKESRRHSLSARGIKNKPQTIQNLDIQRYMGKWYEIKSFPAWFQKGCKDAIAEYEKKQDHIQVMNSCIRDGKLQTRFAKAYQVNGGKLKVDFSGIGIAQGDYWVLYTDYDTALVGTPNRKYLWILARDKTIPKTKEQKLINIAKTQGFDISRLN